MAAWCARRRLELGVAQEGGMVPAEVPCGGSGSVWDVLPPGSGARQGRWLYLAIEEVRGLELVVAPRR